MSESSRKLRFFEKRARSSEKNSNLAAANSLEGFDAFAGDFRVRLDLSESFAGRIERNRRSVYQRFEIREPPLGSRDTFGDDEIESAGTGVRERSDGERVAGTWKPRRV
jgi:hypothetical protein